MPRGPKKKKKPKEGTPKLKRKDRGDEEEAEEGGGRRRRTVSAAEREREISQSRWRARNKSSNSRFSGFVETSALNVAEPGCNENEETCRTSISVRRREEVEYRKFKFSAPADLPRTVLLGTSRKCGDASIRSITRAETSPTATQRECG